MKVTKVVGGCVYIRRRHYGILLRVGGEFEHSALSPLPLRSLSLALSSNATTLNHLIRLRGSQGIQIWKQRTFCCPPLKCNPKLLVLTAYPKITSADFQWIIFGELHYLATALTVFTLSGLLNKAIHKRDPINPRETRPIVGSSASNSQSLQVVGKGMLPHQFTSNFSPKSSVYVFC